MKRAMSALLVAGVVLVAPVSVGQAAAVEATAVTCGSVISAPGDYYLAGDCSGDGIRIMASDVRLELRDHTMTGAPPGEPPPPGGPPMCLFPLGIGASDFPVMLSNLHIEGPGTITGYQTGIALITFGLGGVNRVHVDNVTISNSCGVGAVIQGSDDAFTNVVSAGNFIAGFLVETSDSRFVNDTATGGNRGFDLLGANANQIVNSTASGNSGPGILLSNGANSNHFDGNMIVNNGDVGLGIGDGSTDNHVHGNTAFGNGGFDLADDNPGCDSNNWNGNNFTTSNQSCIH